MESITYQRNAHETQSAAAFPHFLLFPFLCLFSHSHGESEECFLYCKMPARLMSFVQSALTFICPSITVSKGHEMLGKRRKKKSQNFSDEALKQQKHSKEHCGKQLASEVRTVFQKAKRQQPKHFYLPRRMIKSTNNCLPLRAHTSSYFVSRWKLLFEIKKMFGFFF